MALTRLNNRSVSAVTTLPSGIITSADVPVGSVLQVKQSTFNTADFDNSMTTGSIIYGSISITPSSANNKILVFASHHNERANGSGGGVVSASYYYFARIYRNGSVEGPELDNASGHQFPQQARQLGMSQWLDSPNTTSSVSYSVKCSGGSNINSVRWLFYNCRMTVMEIKG